MCAQRRFRSVCTFAQFDQSLHSACFGRPRMQFFFFFFFSCGQRRLWSDRTDFRSYVSSRYDSFESQREKMSRARSEDSDQSRNARLILVFAACIVERQGSKPSSDGRYRRVSFAGLTYKKVHFLMLGIRYEILMWNRQHFFLTFIDLHRKWLNVYSASQKIFIQWQI